MAALTAATAEPTAAAAADTRRLPFFLNAGAAAFGAGLATAFGLGAGFFARAAGLAARLALAALTLPALARPALALGALREAFFADLLVDLADDLRAVFLAAGLDAPFLFAGFLAFLAVGAGFFRAMTNPFGSFLDSLR